MTIFIKQGNKYFTTSEEALETSKLLPAKTFSVGVTPKGEFFLESVADFSINHKIYGDVLSKAGRIFQTFMARKKSTGVLLKGLKGSGKTLLTKKLSMIGIESGIPTLVINSEFCGENFNKFLQSINQECIVIFDEFEKVYSDEGQDAILTLFDGTYDTKKLFLVTCNDTFKINRHMIDRPGRLYYSLSYDGLDQKFIEEYVDDNLENKAHRKELLILCSMLGSISFDILQALVEEINRYDEKPMQALKMLNISLSTYSESFEVIVDSKTVDIKDHTKIVKVSPFVSHFNVDYWDGSVDEDGDPDWESLMLSASEIVKADVGVGEFIYEKDGFVVQLKKIVPKTTELDISKYDY